MNIGEKLKTSRVKSNLTQEEVAEILKVSRQTISNWENERSYPDLIYILELSDLYNLSLDALIKGDNKMKEHLEESTNVVASNKKLLHAIIINIVLFIVMFITFAFLEINMLIILIVFMMMIASVSYLMIQIINKI